MRTPLRLLALLAGFLAVPVLVALAGGRLGLTDVEVLLAALGSFPLSAAATLIVGAAFTKARRTVAEVQAP
jgi:hypothetical protein